MSSALRSTSLAEKLGLLREVALFSGLSEDDIAAIGHATTMTHCSRGQQILSPDDPPDRIHIVKCLGRSMPARHRTTIIPVDSGTRGITRPSLRRVVPDRPSGGP